MHIHTMCTALRTHTTVSCNAHSARVLIFCVTSLFSCQVEGSGHRRACVRASCSYVHTHGTEQYVEDKKMDFIEQNYNKQIKCVTYFFKYYIFQECQLGHLLDFFGLF